MQYTFENEKDTETYHFTFKDITEARHFVINTLDLSKNWSILVTKEG